jgi:hypothetical protein
MRIALLLLLVACGKSERPKVPSACITLTTCEEYQTDKKSYLEGRKNECKTANGTWAELPCPAEAMAGGCREQQKEWTRTRYYKVVDEKVKAECGAYGTWVDPPKH